MNLTVEMMQDRRRTIKTTVLHRAGGVWHNEEVSRVVSGLQTEAAQHPKYPEDLLLFGHFDKARVLKALWGGEAFTCEQLVGEDAMPFKMWL